MPALNPPRHYLNVGFPFGHVRTFDPSDFIRPPLAGIFSMKTTSGDLQARADIIAADRRKNSIPMRPCNLGVYTLSNLAKVYPRQQGLESTYTALGSMYSGQNFDMQHLLRLKREF